MKKIIELAEKKEIMLSIMDFIDSFCKKNKIKYFLYTGSLIGAIRHNGYIPWDDDIDICMLRKDYDLFINLFKDNSGRYKLITHETNSDYHTQLAKVYDSNTVLKESIPRSIPIGVFVDIFPLDSCSDDYKEACKFGNSIRIYRTIVDVKNIAFSPERTLCKNAILLLLKTLFLPFPRKIAIKIINNKAQMYKNKQTKYVGQFTKMIYSSNEIFESEWFNESIDASFENRIYCIPKEYDKVLKNIYGDYLKMPPKDKQVTHHSNYAWWK